MNTADLLNTGTNRLRVLGVIVAACSALLGTETFAQDIQSFKLTSFQGVLSSGYQFYEREDGSAGASSSQRSQELFANLFIRTKGFVYHPALLNFQFDGGPLYLQKNNDTGADESSNQGSLFSYNLRLNFLGRKSYPHSIFVRSVYPELATGLSGRFRSRNFAYGVDGQFPLPLTPLRVYWTASHTDSEGTGLGAVEDASTDNASLRTELPYFDGIRFNVEWTEQESRRGSPGLPIVETLNENLGMRLANDYTFGGGRQFRLSQNLSRLQNKTTSPGTPESRSFRYGGSLNWNNSSRMSSFGNYRYFDGLRGTERTRSQGSSVGMGYALRPNLKFNGSGYWSSNDNVGFSQRATGLNASITHVSELKIGRLTLTGAGALGRTDQQSFRDTGEIFDESIVLVGITAIALQQEFVVENSVVVTNVDRTQTFVEGFDYRLAVIGATTTIERIGSGNIFDGQEVLVSYEYSTGGTVEYGSSSQSISADLAPWQNVSFSVSLAKSGNDIISGIATNPLNDSERFEVRGRATYPFRSGFSIGGEIRHTKQDEDIMPFVGTKYDAFLLLNQLRNTRIRLELNAQQVNYETSREDVDRTGYSLGIDTSVPGGMRLSYGGSVSEDDGGSISRKTERHDLSLFWRYRLLVFSLTALHSKTSQDSTRRKDTEVKMQIQRYF